MHPYRIQVFKKIEQKYKKIFCTSLYIQSDLAEKNLLGLTAIPGFFLQTKRSVSFSSVNALFG